VYILNLTGKGKSFVLAGTWLCFAMATLRPSALSRSSSGPVRRGNRWSRDFRSVCNECSNYSTALELKVFHASFENISEQFH